MFATRPISAASLRIIAACAATNAVADTGAEVLYGAYGGTAMLHQPGARAIRIMVLNAADKPSRQGPGRRLATARTT